MKLTRYYVSSDGSLVSVVAHIPTEYTRAVYLASEVDQLLKLRAEAPATDTETRRAGAVALGISEEELAAATTETPAPRSIALLRQTLSTLCHFVWHRQTRPGEHLWSIPVDAKRDFDCILSDAIDELERLRAEALAPSPDTGLPVQTFTDTEIAAVDRALQIESLSLELRGKVIQTIALSGRR